MRFDDVDEAREATVALPLSLLVIMGLDLKHFAKNFSCSCLADCWDNRRLLCVY